MAYVRRIEVKGLLVVTGWMVVTTFVFYQSFASFKTYLINRRDLAVTERILTRVESHPDFFKEVSGPWYAVFLVGDLSDFGASLTPPYGHVTKGPMSTSAIQSGIYDTQPNRFTFAVRQLSYRKRFCYILNHENMEEILEISWFKKAHIEHLYERWDEIEPWPAASSIVIDGDIVFVVLSKPLRFHTKAGLIKRTYQDEPADEESNDPTITVIPSWLF